MLQPPKKLSTAKTVSLTVLLFWAFLSLMPMLWMASTSLKPVTSYLKMPPEIIPLHPSLTNYVDLLTNAPHWWRWVANSIIVTTVVTVANLLFCSMAGYAFAKKRFPGGQTIFWVIVMSMMLPQQVTLIPLYQVAVRLGLYDNFGGLCIPFLSTAFGIFLMKQFSATLSTDMLEAGRIDGCSEIGLFFRIVLPLVKPALAVLGIFTVMWQWNDFLWPLVITNSVQMKTLQVGLSTLQSKWSTDYGTLMAGAGLSAIPMIAVFLGFQRYFIQGLRLGAIKG